MSFCRPRHHSSVGTTPCYQRRPPVAYHLHGLATHVSAVDPRCLARCLIGTFCITPRPKLHFNKLLTESRGQDERPVEYSPKATLCDLASKLRQHNPLLRKQRRSPLLITCTVLCVSLMGTGAGLSVRRLPLSALSKDGQQDIAACDSPRTKASKLRRHDPLFPEQRGPPLLITCMVCPPISWLWIQGLWRGASQERSAPLHGQSFVSTNLWLRVEARVKRPARNHGMRCSRVVGTNYRQV